MTETITTVHTYDQPIETSIKVTIEVDSKGQRKPSIEVRITRKINAENTDKFYDLIMNDIQLALSRCKDTLTNALEER